jgi:hypothetical protein
MARVFTGFIDENECIGDSLGTEGVTNQPKGSINGNTLSLDEAVQALSGGSITTASNDFSVGSNLTVSNDLTATGSITTLSEVRTNTIRSTTGTTHFENGYPRQPGQIIEYLTSPCDGSSVTVGSGTYTFSNVVDTQVLDDTFTDITGSTIVYTPPAGTTRVVYRFNVMIGSSNTQTINAWRLLVDDQEIINARRAYSAHSYYDDGSQFEWTFAIGGTETINVGRYSTWTSAKTIKLQARKWPGNYRSLIHSAYHYPGIGNGYTKPLMIPTLTIVAIA